MTAAREHILARIRAANGGERPEGRTAELRARLARTAPHLLPARAMGDGVNRVDDFIAQAEQSRATVIRTADSAQVPAAIAGCLKQAGLGGDLVVSPHPSLVEMPWREAPALSVRHGRAEGADAIGVTPAVAGIAETGTLLVHSGTTLPNTLHFLPETHIAVLRAADIVGGYEEAWQKMRSTIPEQEWPPRSATLITGPSRTSDIEKTLQIGVHGPRRLFIVLIDGEKT